jgi:ADP-ribose pyrophosphatase
MSKVLGSGNYLRLMQRGQWEFVQRPNANGAVAVIAVNDQGSLILVEQYRHALQEHVLELPAGLVGDEGDENFEEAARRELLEETGYLASNLRLVGHGPVSPGMTDEMFTLFYTDSVTRMHAGGGTEGENITVQEWNPKLLMQRMNQMPEGHLMDLKLYIALHFLQQEGKLK